MRAGTRKAGIPVVSRPTSCPIDPAQRDELLEICARTFQRPNPDGSLPRQFHRKTHACLRATLTIDPPDDPGIRHGLFARPGRYHTLARFSNSFFAEDDHPDARGLALKVTGVEGPVCNGAPPGQQDFVLMNAETGPARDADEAMELFRSLDGLRRATISAVAAPRYLFPSLLPWRARWRYLAFLCASGLQHWRGYDLTQLSYGSVTPYRIGDGAMKFALVPDAEASVGRPTKGKDFSGKLQSALDAGPIRFDFRLQRRVLESDPMEDVRQAWRSPAVLVGRLEIPPQDVAATVDLGDRLTFSPWNCLAAHTPLGSINALRRAAYAVSAANRGAEATAPGEGGS